MHFSAFILFVPSAALDTTDRIPLHETLSSPSSCFPLCLAACSVSFLLSSSFLKPLGLSPQTSPPPPPTCPSQVISSRPTASNTVHKPTISKCAPSPWKIHLKSRRLHPDSSTEHVHKKSLVSPTKLSSSVHSSFGLLMVLSHSLCQQMLLVLSPEYI